MAAIDPSTWPARISEIQSRLVSRLSTPGMQILTAGFLRELTQERGLEETGDTTPQRHPVGEVEYLLREALYQLEMAGLIMQTGAGGGRDWQHITAMAEHLEWQDPQRLSQPGYPATQPTWVSGRIHPDSEADVTWCSCLA